MKRDMKKQLLVQLLVLILISLFSIQLIYAQPNTLWTKTFGGSNSDYGSEVQQTFDGGYIITGYTKSYGAGSNDAWLIRTDSSGDTLWTKTFGRDSDDYSQSVQQTSDSGYVITGSTNSSGAGLHDVWLIKTDTVGDTLWTKTFGGSGSDQGNSVRQTFDGGYIVTGYTKSYGAGGSDVWLIKTDASGEDLWTKTFGRSGNDYGQSVRQTFDGGYIITGFTDSFGAGLYDIWLIKTDASGDTLWTKNFGGNDYEEGYSVRQTIDGGYIITGRTWSLSKGVSNADIRLIKTDASNNILWTKTYGGSYYEKGNSVQQTSDCGYIITGYTESYGANIQDAWLVRTDASGNTLWTKTFGGVNIDEGNSVQQTSDGGYIVTGSTRSYGAGSYDIWLIKIDPDPSQVVSGSAYFKENGRIRITEDNPANSSTNPSAYIISGNTITVEAWVFPTQLPGEGQKYSIVKRPYYGKEPKRAYELCINNFNADGSPHYLFAITDGTVPVNGAFPTDPNPVKIRSWTHIVGTYNGLVARLYINGIMVAEAPFSGNIGAGDTGFYIGGLYQIERFQGLIDEVCLWNVALTQAEIKTYGCSTLTGEEPGLAGYWPLDKATEIEGNFPVAVDFTYNHNDLLIQFGTEFVYLTPIDKVANIHRTISKKESMTKQYLPVTVDGNTTIDVTDNAVSTTLNTTPDQELVVSDTIGVNLEDSVYNGEPDLDLPKDNVDVIKEKKKDLTFISTHPETLIPVINKEDGTYSQLTDSISMNAVVAPITTTNLVFRFIAVYHGTLLAGGKSAITYRQMTPDGQGYVWETDSVRTSKDGIINLEVPQNTIFDIHGLHEGSYDTWEEVACFKRQGQPGLVGKIDAVDTLNPLTFNTENDTIIVYKIMPGYQLSDHLQYLDRDHTGLRAITNNDLLFHWDLNYLEPDSIYQA